MGVIFRQSLKSSFVNYFGAVLGVISTIFIYPLDKSTYGLVQFLQSSAMILVPFFLLGANFISTRFFPEFEHEENGHNGYWGFLTAIIIIGFVVFSTAFYLFQPQILLLYKDKSALFQSFIPYILPLALLIGFLQFNVSFASNFQRIAVPAVFVNLIKFSLPVLIYLHFRSWITVEGVVNGVVLNYSVALLGILVYLWLLKGLHWKINWSFISKDRVKRIGNYALYGMIAGIGSVLAFRIDTVMVPSLIDLKSNGVYSIAMFIGNAIAIPAAAILSISSPILSKSFTNNDLAEITNIYNKSSINLLIVGVLLLCLILPNVEDLFQLMAKSEEMAGGYWIVFFIGLAKVVEMGTSVNHHIISHSNFYGLNLIMIVFLAIANVLLNLLLIPTYGLAGAALATFISISSYNLIKVGIIYWKLKIQPFSRYSLFVSILGVFLFSIFSSLSLNWHPVLNIALRGTLICLLFIPAIYYSKCSPELNQVIQQGISTIRSKF